LLLEYGYEEDEIGKGTRNYLTGEVRNICEKTLHIKREDIGIIAADRAQYYFKGVWRDVGLKEIEELSQCGQDMLVIEKEGIAEQLAPFADEMGIGLLNTRGFPVEYAEILAKISAQKRCNVAILTDFDDSGLLMAARAPNIYRIGIDFQTLKDLNLDIADVEEAYNPGKHFKSLKPGGEHYGIYSDEILNYIKNKRVEINSIITAIHDNARFWEWILEKLRKQFHNRDYNRSITVPEYVIPECLESLNDKVKEKGIAILKQRRKKLKDRLSNIGPGFLFDRTNRVLKNSAEDITISMYEEMLIEHSKHIIESDNGIRPLLDKIEDLTGEELMHDQVI
jgi:hypothetical protein